MNNKGKVKVIKKGTQKAPEIVAKVNKTHAKATAREMVSNVSNWVSEFQQKRREETRQAFEQLFATQVQPNNV